MMFRRRSRPSLLRRLRQLIWPRSGFRRAARYVGWRVVRLPGTAHTIAGGFAWGAAVSFTPFIGLHFILGGLGAWLTRCNVIASAIGTAIGNPWTFPFIWALIYRTGTTLLGRTPGEAPPMETLAALFTSIWQFAGHWVLFVVGLGDRMPAPERSGVLLDVTVNVLWPMVVGALPFFAIVWAVCYFPLRRLVERYQQRRIERLLKRREGTGAVAAGVPNIGS